MKQRIQSAEETAVNAEADLETAESKLTLMNGEPVLGDSPVKLRRLKSLSEKAKQELMSACEILEAKEALLVRALDENEVLLGL